MILSPWWKYGFLADIDTSAAKEPLVFIPSLS